MYPWCTKLSSVLIAVKKMIGISRVRLLALISVAVSKPSISGICTSSRMIAQSCSNR